MRAPFGVTRFGGSTGSRINIDVSLDDNSELVDRVNEVYEFAATLLHNIYADCTYKPLLSDKHEYSTILQWNMNLDYVRCWNTDKEILDTIDV